MNADAWVHPNAIYSECQTRELRARQKWNLSHGRNWNYDMSAPPRHRQCPFMSWMAELPDDFVAAMEEYEHSKARRDFGGHKMKESSLAIPKQLQHKRRPVSYKHELQTTRAKLVASLKQVQDELAAHPDTPPTTASTQRPQSALTRPTTSTAPIKLVSRPQSAKPLPRRQVSENFERRFQAAVGPARVLINRRKQLASKHKAWH
eukprot:TRINITY_DN20077_c0_g1_i8.p1 TRINITY_DN20077_c0_g1~~TRINITY_DN20077_c0_g1_i8.p1  ORF type:complete len:205 (-),score=40.10 TRINITY_DN20077_c0_g1_i8:287-901(-)